MQDINSLLNIALEIEGLVRVLMIRDDAQVRALLVQKAKVLESELSQEPSSAPAVAYVPKAEPLANDATEALDDAPAQDEEDMAPIDLDSTFSVDILEFDEGEPEHKADDEKKAEEKAQTENAAEGNAPVEQNAVEQKAVEQEVVEQNLIEPQPPRPAKSFITFNEKYRFVRELFNNQHAVMNDVVAKVTGMHSLPEAHDYVLNELNLDEDNPVVIEFLEVIARYFNSRS